MQCMLGFADGTDEKWLRLGVCKAPCQLPELKACEKQKVEWEYFHDVLE